MNDLNTEPEQPRGGGQWLNGSEVHENSRLECARRARAVSLSDGDNETAAAIARLRAREFAALRDRAHRQGADRAMSRHLRAQRRW